MAIFRMEKGKEKAGKCVWGNVLAEGGTVPAYADGVCLLPQVQGLRPWKAWEGKVHNVGMGLRRPGREERLDRHRRWEFPGAGRSGEGRSEEIKRELGGITFNNQPVGGWALVGAEGLAISQDTY